MGAIETFDQCNLNVRKKGSLEGEWVLSKHSINANVRKKRKSSFSTNGCYGNIRSMKLFEKKRKVLSIGVGAMEIFDRWN